MLTGATPSAASRALRDTLQQALACVTLTVLASGTVEDVQRLRAISRLVPGDGASPITLTIQHWHRTVTDPARPARERWHAATTGYVYALDDADGREIVSYHWHPHGRSHVSEPHLHLGAGAGALRHELTKAHLLTGAVTPVVILRLTIEAFSVRPHRADWPSVLDRAQARLQDGLLTRRSHD